MDNENEPSTAPAANPLPQSGPFRPLPATVRAFHLRDIPADWSALAAFLGPEYSAHLDTADGTSVRLASPGTNVFLRPGQWLVLDGSGFAQTFDDPLFRDRFEPTPRGKGKEKS